MIFCDILLISTSTINCDTTGGIIGLLFQEFESSSHDAPYNLSATFSTCRKKRDCKGLEYSACLSKEWIVRLKFEPVIEVLAFGSFAIEDCFAYVPPSSASGCARCGECLIV